MRSTPSVLAQGLEAALRSVEGGVDAVVVVVDGRRSRAGALSLAGANVVKALHATGILGTGDVALYDAGIVFSYTNPRCRGRKSRSREPGPLAPRLAADAM